MEFTQGVRFDSLGLLPEMTRALEKKNIEWSTPVQAGCIPPMREWKDVIAKAPTGTGKTFAFGIPIIEHIDPESEEVQAVIMAPTRELAMQITAELRDLAVFMSGIRVVCLYGGAPIGKQIDALKKKPQIVVATPGRLSDHMKRRTVRLDRVQTVVLDEADRMLDMGFIHDVTRILDKIPSRRNLGMFSATISREVMDISWVYQRDPEEITVRADEQNKPDILQYAVTVEQTDKVAAMARIIRQEKLERVMVFCNTKGMVSWVTAISSGRVPSGRVRPARAADIMAPVPAAWTFTRSTSSADRAAIAFFTVLGISCSFRSRKILWPRARISRTMEGPSA